MALRQAVAAGADAPRARCARHARRRAGGSVTTRRSTRTTDGRGSIAAMTLVEGAPARQRLLVGARRGRSPGPAPRATYVARGRAPADPGLRIATLEEVLEEFPGVLLNLDIKADGGPRWRPMRPSLGPPAAPARPGRDDVIVGVVQRRRQPRPCRRSAPEIPTSAGTLAIAQFPPGGALRGGAAHNPARRPCRCRPTTCRSRSWTSRWWPRPTATGSPCTSGRSTSPREMDRLLDLGIDGIMSDRPSVVTDVLRRRGQAWSRERVGPDRRVSGPGLGLAAVVGLLAMGPRLGLLGPLRHAQRLTEAGSLPSQWNDSASSALPNAGKFEPLQTRLTGGSAAGGRPPLLHDRDDGRKWPRCPTPVSRRWAG